MTLYPGGLEVLLPKRGMLPLGDTIIPSNCKFNLPSGHSVLRLPLCQWETKGANLLTHVIGPKYQETELPLHNGSKER